jgi:general secretion pathway protein K
MPMPAHPRTNKMRSARRPDGFIVVAVLWILGALATLASIYAVYVVNTAVAFGVHDDRLKAEGMVKAGVELATYLISAKPEERQTQGAFVLRMGQANVAVDFRSEMARVDLNVAPKELLTGLFTVFGAATSNAETYAERVIGWRKPPAEAGADPESSAYRAAGLRYPPRGGNFAHVGELSLVMGLPPLLVDRVQPFVTVYSGQAQVNVFEAAPEILAALPGMTPDRLPGILAQRRRAGPQNGPAVLAMLGPAQASATAEGGKTIRVSVRIGFDNGRRMSSEVVILMIDEGPEPYRVLSWHDELDDSVPDARARTVLR